MSHDFWLGVAAVPAAAFALASLWWVLRLLGRAGAWLVNRLSVNNAKHLNRRAELGAIMSCARRSWWLALPFDAVLILAIGHDMTRANDVRSAIRGVLTPTPRKVRVRAPRSEEQR